MSKVKNKRTYRHNHWYAVQEDRHKRMHPFQVLAFPTRKDRDAYVNGKQKATDPVWHWPISRRILRHWLRLFHNNPGNVCRRGYGRPRELTETEAAARCLPATACRHVVIID